MARRGNELDAKAAHVKVHIAESVQFELTAVTTAGRHRAQLERTPEKPLNFLCAAFRRNFAPFAKEQSCTRGGGDFVIVGVADRAFGTCLGAQWTKDARAEIDRQRI